MILWSWVGPRSNFQAIRPSLDSGNAIDLNPSVYRASVFDQLIHRPSVVIHLPNHKLIQALGLLVVNTQSVGSTTRSDIRMVSTMGLKWRYFGSVLIISIVLLSTWSWKTEEKVDLFDPAEKFIQDAKQKSLEFISNPPEVSDFRLLGDRLRIVNEWIEGPNTVLNMHQMIRVEQITEDVIHSHFPFLTSTKRAGPLQTLKGRLIPGSKGIVISVGKDNFRYACHLIGNLRHVLKSALPIQIAYGGEHDLPKEFQEFITTLDEKIELLDITTIFDERELKLKQGGWAIKPFAALASSFEQVLLLDADVIFLQRPERLLNEHPQYLETGTMLFHDRLIWQGAFKERLDWWRKELTNLSLSETSMKSKVLMDGWAEEGDAGVVAIDKTRTRVFLGLLHICWQNTPSVRSQWTYRLGYGDKESYWFGFELTGVKYAMEDHYASILGDRVPGDGNDPEKVCSYIVGHVDHEKRLFWYNGSLLKNKKVPLEFDLPAFWMIDGVWEKGTDQSKPSCMKNREVQSITSEESFVLSQSIKVAQEADQMMRKSFRYLIPTS